MGSELQGKILALQSDAKKREGILNLTTRKYEASEKQKQAINRKLVLLQAKLSNE